jgi:hypothetical protein
MICIDVAATSCNNKHQAHGKQGQQENLHFSILLFSFVNELSIPSLSRGCMRAQNALVHTNDVR